MQSGTYFVYALPSAGQRTRLIEAAETLKRICSAPAPRPTPSPAPRQADTPAPKPWLVRYSASECYPRDLPKMMLGSPQAARYSTSARAGVPGDFLSYVYYLDGNGKFLKQASWIFANSSRTNGEVRSAKLLFDGRPSNIPLSIRPLSFRESGRVDLPLDLVDRLVNISSLSVMLLDARGNVLHMYDFDVRGASRFKEHGNRAKWSCAEAR